MKKGEHKRKLTEVRRKFQRKPKNNFEGVIMTVAKFTRSKSGFAQVRSHFIDKKSIASQY